MPRGIISLSSKWGSNPRHTSQGTGFDLIFADISSRNEFESSESDIVVVAEEDGPSQAGLSESGIRRHFPALPVRDRRFGRIQLFCLPRLLTDFHGVFRALQPMSVTTLS